MKIPRLLEYEQYMDCVLSEYQLGSNIHPCLLPNFDHSPRSAHRGCIIVGNTPEKWGKLCRQMFNKLQTRSQQENLLFVKSWNEWGEGNYMEPDIKFGKGYIEYLRKALEEND